MSKVREVDIARCVVEYLDSIGWDVYQEVQVRGRVADIVGLLGSRTWVIETKTTFNLAVMEQANSWLQFSQYVSIAVPSARRSTGRDFGRRICLERGIGIIYVTNEFDRWKVKEDESPKLRRFVDRAPSRKWFLRDSERLRGTLCSEHKTFAVAGTASGSYWTPFKATCRSVINYILKNQGCHLREVINSIEHHYANDNSAYTSLLHWISIGKVDGLMVDTRKRPFRYYTTSYRGIELVRFRMGIREDEKNLIREDAKFRGVKVSKKDLNRIA